MYGALVLAAVFLATTLSPFGMRPVGVRQMQRTVGARPNVVENGTNTISYPVPALAANQSNLAFAPDGSAYFMRGSNEVDRVSPDGTFARIYVPHAEGAYGKIIYAQNSLWMTAFDGIIQSSLDGSQRKFYKIATCDSLRCGSESSLVPAATGGVFVTESFTAASGAPVSNLYRIDARGKLTTTALSVNLDGLVPTRAGDFFSVAYGIAKPYAPSIAHVSAGGVLTLMPLSINPGAAGSAMGDAFAHGNFYFEQAALDPQGNEVVSLLRLNADGTLTNIPLPGAPNSSYDGLTVDQYGNLWTVIYFGINPNAQLYHYDVRGGRFDGPYTSATYCCFYRTPALGADDNLWWLSADYSTNEAHAMNIFVRKVQTLEPASVSVAVGKTAYFSILETGFNGPWTAQSLAPSVVTVSPASSTTGEFFVDAVGPGLTSIAVKDKLGNVSYELVTTF